MSIINEALKKVYQEKPAPLSAHSSANDKKFLPELPKKKNKVNWGPVFVLLVLVLITGPLIAPIFSSPYKSTASPLLTPASQEIQTMTAEAEITDTENLKKQFAIEEAPRLQAQMAGMLNKPQIDSLRAESRPNFLMNGIAYSPTGSYCIINGAVVKVGEKIDGAILQSVTPEKATLDFQGTKIELWVNH